MGAWGGGKRMCLQMLPAPSPLPWTGWTACTSRALPLAWLCQASERSGGRGVNDSVRVALRVEAAAAAAVAESARALLLHGRLCGGWEVLLRQPGGMPLGCNVLCCIRTRPC